MTEENVSNQRERGRDPLPPALPCPAQGILRRRMGETGGKSLAHHLQPYVDVTFYLAEAQTTGADA